MTKNRRCIQWTLNIWQKIEEILNRIRAKTFTPGGWIRVVDPVSTEIYYYNNSDPNRRVWAKYIQMAKLDVFERLSPPI